jgi:hypothetical protein
MKKMLSITFLAAVLAVGTSFASKLSTSDSTTEWMLSYDSSIVVGLQSEIKTRYCAGANVVECAMMTVQPFTLIRKP